MLTDKEIDAAKARTKYSSREEPHHEHSDCVRIAYEWLDAQSKIKGVTKKTYQLKHFIERWAGRYVSQMDVDVAAELHSEIKGTYPNFNISTRLTRPNFKRLEGVGEAFTQNYKERPSDSPYSKEE